MLITITVFRFLLPILGALILFLAVKLIKPPKQILYLALKLCWIAGALNLLVDIIQEHLDFWHYTVRPLFLGYPFDLYLAVSLVIGGALPLIYWWLKSFHAKWVFPVLLALPFYFLLEDFLVQKFTGDTIAVWDSAYWWLADFASIFFIICLTVFIFSYFEKASKEPGLK